MSKLYVALGCQESRVEIAMLRQDDRSRRTISLRSIQLRQGVICADSGRLIDQQELARCIHKETASIVATHPVDVAIAIPDALCRTRTVRNTSGHSHGRRISSVEEQSFDGESVIDIYPTSSTRHSGEVFMVACPTVDIMQYVSAVDHRGWILSSITPLMVARYNCLLSRGYRPASTCLLLVHTSPDRCDIALWSNELLVYRERVTRACTQDAWESECEGRVQAVAQRVEGSYVLVIRGPLAMARLLDSKLSERCVSLERKSTEHPLADSVEGELESRELGYFDASLGLLAQSGVCRG
jgi:hypothetical protein